VWWATFNSVLQVPSSIVDSWIKLKFARTHMMQVTTKTGAKLALIEPQRIIMRPYLIKHVYAKNWVWIMKYIPVLVLTIPYSGFMVV